ncbi:DUF2905 domain-containing protein [Roseivirga sp. BDSF3-8]|uniref:DUF2905 domain-containing protein n=1 Tax=Roseivirga sp. BDSF3-8 TaxID=3241598 RepID=UPI00353210F7
MTEQTGKMLMVAGAVIFFAGLIFFIGSKTGGLGKLPGDIVVKKPGFSFYFPLGTSILLSIILSLLLYLYYKLRG